MNKKIVFIDDNPDILITVKALLESVKTYSVETYSDPVDGFKKISKKKPDLLLLDIMMPELDGITMAKKIRASSKLNDLPIVFVTAKTSADIEKDQDYADFIIEKPFDSDTFLGVVESIFAK